MKHLEGVRGGTPRGRGSALVFEAVDVGWQFGDGAEEAFGDGFTDVDVLVEVAHQGSTRAASPTRGTLYSSAIARMRRASWGAA